MPRRRAVETAAIRFDIVDSTASLSGVTDAVAALGGRIRALATGTGTAFVRLASIIGPFVVGMILPAGGLGGVFLMFAIASLVGGIITIAFGMETRGRTLEELSP